VEVLKYARHNNNSEHTPGEQLGFVAQNETMTATIPALVASNVARYRHMDAAWSKALV
jgi:hypothetical protein